MNLKIFLNTNLSYLFLTLVCLYLIFKASFFDSNDFATYYFASRFLVDGDFSSSLYEIINFNLKIKELGYNNIFGSFTPNTPFLAVFFIPFTLFSLGTAKIIFNVFSLAIFIFSLKRIFDYYKVEHIYLFFIPIIFFISIRNNFLFGQLYLILFFFLSEGFLAYKKKQYILMSILWGFAILLKVFPLIIFVFLLFRKQYKAIIYLTTSCALLLFISIIINGFNIWEFYFSTVLPKANNGEIARKQFVINYQSMYMMLKYLFVYNISENNNPLINNYKLFSTLILLFKIVILGIGYIISKVEKNDLKVFSFWIFASILISPYGSTYINVLLLFPFIVFVLHQKKDSYKHIIVFLIIFLIINTPIHYFEKLSIAFSFPRLLLYLILFVFLSKPYLKSRKIIFILLFAIPILIGNLIALNFTKKVEFDELINNQEKLLIYNYEISNQKIKYSYWEENILKEKLIDFEYKKVNDKDVHLKNNQIYYKTTQLTYSNDLKRKPLIIDNKTILFLTDRGRGVGFFNLKKFELQ